jgi:chromate transporter
MNFFLAQRVHRPEAVQRLGEVAGAFLKLGLISFGGQVAHLGYLRAEGVGRRRWIEDTAYGDLMALCQFLPGPSSGQLVFALGAQRAGWAVACWLRCVSPCPPQC